jgi:hypothetical protein
VELASAQQDPYVRFGDVLQLVHAHTGAALVVDVSDKVGLCLCASTPHVCGMCKL